MPRIIPSTSYTSRTEVTSEYSARRQTGFIMTQALNFLMTQDDNYLVVQDSIVSNYTARTKITTLYS